VKGVSVLLIKEADRQFSHKPLIQSHEIGTACPVLTSCIKIYME